MNNTSRVVAPQADFLDGCREDLQGLGIDCQKVREHVCRNLRAGAWSIVYKPSCRRSLNPPPGNSVPEGERKRMQKTGEAAEWVEIMLAYEIASKDPALASMGICFDELARQASIAKEALRLWIKRTLHVCAVRSRGGKAGQRRYDPPRQEVIRLLHVKKPEGGWPDIPTAATVILPDVYTFLVQHPSLQRGKNLPTTLKRWMKNDPDVALAFAQTERVPIMKIASPHAD